jgi:hypothetical protein
MTVVVPVGKGSGLGNEVLGNEVLGNEVLGNGLLGKDVSSVDVLVAEQLFPNPKEHVNPS